MLIQSGLPTKFVYFPVTAVVSLMLDLEDGSGAEFALVGREGFVGFFLFLDETVSRASAVVQCSGTLYRMQAATALRFFDQSSLFRQALMRYMQFLVAEAAQNASCYRHHSIEQQLCKLLLRYMDRRQSSHLLLTHDMLARSLGVRRESLTLAARKLRELSFIKYSRGHIEILSPSGLQAHSCECYRVLLNINARLSVSS